MHRAASTRPATPLALALGLAALALVAARPAAAERCLPESPAGVCRFLVAGAFPFEARDEDIREGAVPGSFEVEGELSLETPGGSLPLAETLARFQEDPNGTIWLLGGFARAPIGALLAQVGVEFDASPVTYFGLGKADELRALLEDPADPSTRLPLAENEDPDAPGALLDPTYLFFHAERGLDLSVPLPLPASVSGGAAPALPLSRKQVITLILDPTDPYFYVANVGKNGVLDKIQDERERRQARKQLRKESKKEQKARKKAAKAEAKSDPDRKKDKKKKKAKKKNKKKRKAPRGALAFSWLGGIPFDPIQVPAPASGLLDELPWLGALEGHLFVRGPSPMGPFVLMDGSTVTGLLEDGVVMGGFGEAEVTLPYIGQILSFGFPLGDAVAALTVSGDVQEVAVRGVLDPSSDFLPDLVPVSAEALLDVEAVLGSDLGRTHVSAIGAFELDTKLLGQRSGASLSKIELEGELSLDGQGFHLRGTTSQSVHPSIGAAGEIEVEAFFTGNPAEDFVRLRGALAVAGIALGTEAALEIRATGVTVTGELDTGLTQIALLGALTRRGPHLEGTGTVTLSLGALEGQVAEARAEVERLEGELSALRALVRSERLEASADWRAARGDVDAARAAVSALEGDIDDLEDDIDDLEDGYETCSIGLGYAACVARNAAIAAEVALLEADILVLEGSLGTARTALSAASSVLAGIEDAILAAPIDADPRIVAVLGTLEVARLALDQALAALAALPDAGTVSATLHVVLDRRGLSGSATVAGGASAEVSFTPAPELCVGLAGQGDLCVAF